MFSEHVRERTERNGWMPSQTHLSEFEDDDVDLYPERGQR